MTPAALPTREAARYLGLSPITMRRLAKRGELPHVRVGKALLFRVVDLDAFLEARTTTQWQDFWPDRARR
ncbi:MAG TPA: helix-turn-helix domain-containing protein [Limnochordia bacterium]|nr:helix-turn-helix domain-containing protein [Limnochordia bacterium]